MTDQSIDLDSPAMSKREALVRAHTLIDILDDLGETAIPDATDRAKLTRARRLIGQVLGVQS